MPTITIRSSCGRVPRRANADREYEARHSGETEIRRDDCRQCRKRQTAAGRQWSPTQPAQDLPGGPILDPVQPTISVWIRGIIPAWSGEGSPRSTFSNCTLPAARPRASPCRRRSSSGRSAIHGVSQTRPPLRRKRPAALPSARDCSHRQSRAEAESGRRWIRCLRAACRPASVATDSRPEAPRW